MVKQQDFDARATVFDLPLYEFVILSSETETNYLDLFNAGASKIDGYCPSCGRDSVFHSRPLQQSKIGDLDLVQGIKRAEFLCTRNVSHNIVIFLEMNFHGDAGNVLFRKIGQVPSHADIANAGMSTFSKFIEKADRSEIIRANGLAAHGVNIGAFVYLRRVFERLIWRAKTRSANAPDDENFRVMRMEEKIASLSDALPSFLVSNKKIYSVLSRGIHELDENSCGQHYELMRMSIFLMLEQEREIYEREERERSLTSLISGLQV